MTARRLAWSAAWLGAGYAVSGLLYWALLNVPESTAVALVASLLLAIAIVTSAAVVTASAAAIGSGRSWTAAIRDGCRALPLAAIGLFAFVAIWVATASAAEWWTGHRGEIDALTMLYARTDRTDWLHAAVSGLLWIGRWGCGLSILGSLTVAGAADAPRLATAARLRAGIRAAISVASLAAVTTAAACSAFGVWRLAYWRPGLITVLAAEPVFVLAKLAALYLAVVVLATASLAVLTVRVTTVVRTRTKIGAAERGPT